MLKPVVSRAAYPEIRPHFDGRGINETDPHTANGYDSVPMAAASEPLYDPKVKVSTFDLDAAERGTGR